MDELSDSFHFLDASLEQSHFIGDAALPEFVDSQGQICDGWICNGSEEVAVSVDHEAILIRGGWLQTTLFDQICVDNRVISKQMYLVKAKFASQI